jgi:hypothetical protein
VFSLYVKLSHRLYGYLCLSFSPVREESQGTKRGQSSLSKSSISKAIGVYDSGFKYRNQTKSRISKIVIV